MARYYLTNVRWGYGVAMETEHERLGKYPAYLTGTRKGKYFWSTDYSHGKQYSEETAKKHILDLVRKDSDKAMIDLTFEVGKVLLDEDPYGCGNEEIHTPEDYLVAAGAMDKGTAEQILSLFNDWEVEEEYPELIGKLKEVASC